MNESEVMIHLQRINSFHLQNQLQIQSALLRNQLLASSRYADPRCLNRFEYEIFSQCGEDGIINEIFNRIGLTNRYFVEFGAGNGIQNNSAALILRNWYGLWIDADPKNAEIIQNKYKQVINRRQLTFLQAFITTENIEDLFKQADVPQEPDLLSVDIDGNDYWIWKNIVSFNPRVVICEYNARYGPDLKWVMRYNPAHQWNGSSYYGASLKSLELLASQKGYRLVACNLAGINAFFIRGDLFTEQFTSLSTSEDHFEPQRSFLMQEPVQRPDFGPFESC